MKNIVIIVIDAVRTKNMSLYGYEKETDKYIKEIANEGTVFTNCFSVSNSTFPMITSLFTGKYPNNHGIVHQMPYMDQSEIDKFKENKFWLPTFLRNKGYSTIYIDWIGLWFKKGFDYYREDEIVKKERFRDKPFIKKIILHFPNWIYKSYKFIFKKKKKSLFDSADKCVDKAIEKIKELKNPFFLFMHIEDTHFPFPNTVFKGSNKSDIQNIFNNLESSSQKEYIKKRITDIGLHSVSDIINKYDKAIIDTDREIGRFVNFLKSEGKWDNTLLFILADHGESFGEHNIFFSHAGVFDETTHVPLIMKIPNIGKKEINELVQPIDIAPTILDFIGEDIHDSDFNFDGGSLISLINNPGQKIREEVKIFDGLAKDVVAIRSKEKKRITAVDGKCNLCGANHHKKNEEYN